MQSDGRIHDRQILDALEAVEPVPFAGPVWRVVRQGREALVGSAAGGRWSPGGGHDVLYTSCTQSGALVEIGYRLLLEPIWPSKIAHNVHELAVQTDRTLYFADVASLAALGVDGARYGSFDYAATHAIAAAAHFLDFDGLHVPSARDTCHNLVIFMDKFDNHETLEDVSCEPVDWEAWRTDWRKKR